MTNITVDARNVPPNYSNKMCRREVSIYMSTDTVNEFSETIDWYHALYEEYIHVLWNCVDVDGVDRYIKPIKFFKGVVKKIKKKPRMVTRAMIDRILWYVYKIFIMYNTEIFRAKYTQIPINFELIPFIESFADKLKVDIPVFTTENDNFVFNRSMIGLDDLYNGTIKIPKYGNMFMNQNDITNLPELDSYIQGIMIMNPKKHYKKIDHFGSGKNPVYLVPCIIYYNTVIYKTSTVSKAKIINELFGNSNKTEDPKIIKMLKHLHYYETLGLIMDISFSEESGIYYCVIRYYETTKDKKCGIPTLCDLHDIIRYPNNEDLKIIKKYADKHFRCKNDFHYDIIIMKDGTVSFKYEKNKERKK